MYYIGNRGNKITLGTSEEEQANTLASTYAAAVKAVNDGIILAVVEGDTDAVADYKADEINKKQLKAAQDALNHTDSWW